MKASSGRLSQFHLLNSVESISKHLVETELFSKASFYDFIEKYNTFVILPAFGPGEVCVSAVNNQFKIVSKSKIVICTEKEAVYQHLVRHEIKQKYYVIKPLKISRRYAQGNCRYLVTVHRKSASHVWSFHSYTEKMNTTNGRGIYKYFRHEIGNLSMLVAKKLGEYFPTCHTVVVEIVYDMEIGIWIHDTMLHLPRSKWNQYLTLMMERSLKPFTPHTDLYTMTTFHDFLAKYHGIIIKPCNGQGGLGIVQVSVNHDHSYEIHSGIQKITKATFEETYHFIEKNYLSEKDYIIQQRLPLAMINGCPFDCRVIVQKVDSAWKTTGKIVKIAAEGFIVTNAAQGLASLEDTIQNSNMLSKSIESLEAKIDEICIAAAGQLEENKTGIKIIGFDIGITKRGEIGIIEGNSVPDLSMFYKLEDKKMYTTIKNIERGFFNSS